MAWSNSKIFRAFLADVLDNTTAMDLGADTFSAGALNLVSVDGTPAAVPSDGSLVPSTVSESPSASVSLASTATVTGVSSSVLAASSFATGGSFTALTVTVTVAVS